MKALVVFESMWGNTEQIARAVAAGLGESLEVTTVAVTDAPADPGAEFGLVVAGGPTHAFSMSRANTRAEALNRGAPAENVSVGLRDWLSGLPTGPRCPRIATFDTRVDKVRHLPGSAAKAAGRVAHSHGYPRAGRPHSFWVHDTDGPLLDGELDRARAWGRELATSVTGGMTVG